jgi:hypothetical protein
MDVYLNGARLIDATDYTASNGSTVGLTSAAQSGDVLELVAYKAFNLGTIDTAAGNFDVSQKLTVTGISTLGNVVSSGIVTADSFSGNLGPGAVTITDTTSSTSSSTGALIVNGGVGIAKSLFVGEGISVGGTITYDDVTNIDSVGIITAGKGLRATTGGIIVSAGVGTFKADVELHGNQGVTSCYWDQSNNQLVFKDSSYAKFGSGGDLAIYHNGTTSYVSGSNGDLYVQTTGSGDDLILQSVDDISLKPQGGESGIEITGNGSVDLYYDNSKKVETTGGGIDVTGHTETDTLKVSGITTLGSRVDVGTGASIHSPASNILTFGTNNTEKARITAAGGVFLNNGTLVERVDRNTSAAANAATALNLDNGMVHWFTTNLGAANVKMNLTSGVGINTALATGDMISVTIMTAVNSTSNFIEQLRVDGVEASAGVTTYWTGGSAPTDGGGSGVDTYAFNLVKTGSGTYDMIANQVKGS